MNTTVTVAQLKKGDRASIIAVTAKEQRHLRKLTAFGVLPGMSIEVLQTSPAYVIAIDHTQLAIDYQIAQYIFVVK